MPGVIAFVIKKRPIPPEPPEQPAEPNFIFNPETYMPPDGDDVNFIFT